MTHVADSMFSSLSEHDLSFVEHQLSHDTVSSDEELHTALTTRGLSDAQATQALRYRDLYLKHTFYRDHTPIRKNKHALRLNRDRMEYELVPC
jgi:hypothetical protein